MRYIKKLLIATIFILLVVFLWWLGFWEHPHVGGRFPSQVGCQQDRNQSNLSKLNGNGLEIKNGIVFQPTILLYSCRMSQAELGQVEYRVSPEYSVSTFKLCLQDGLLPKECVAGKEGHACESDLPGEICWETRMLPAYTGHIYTVTVELTVTSPDKTFRFQSKVSYMYS